MIPPKKNIREIASVRSYPRYSYIRDLSITYEGHGEEVHLQTPEMSAKGMFLHTALILPEGAVIKVKFRLYRLNVEVNARAEVRYSVPGEGVGVEFVDISPEAQQAIEEELGIGDPQPPPEIIG